MVTGQASRALLSARTGRGVPYCVCSEQALTSAVATADLQLLQPQGPVELGEAVGGLHSRPLEA